MGRMHSKGCAYPVIPRVQLSECHAAPSALTPLLHLTLQKGYLQVRSALPADTAILVEDNPR